MASSEPAHEWQEQIHQRVLAHDPTAFAELCEAALPYLVAFLSESFPQEDAHLRETVAIDLLLAYQNRPQQYDPARLSLFAYLRMAARYDMLNQLDRQRRHEGRLVDWEDQRVALAPADRNTEQDDAFEERLQEYTDRPFDEIVAALRADLSAVDEQVLALMLSGERRSAAYAQAMGITHLDEAAQRREVKRAKDRLLKKLKRLGRRIRRDE